MPRMLLDMIAAIVALQAEMVVAGRMQDTAEIVAAVKKTRADVVILNEPTIGPSERIIKSSSTVALISECSRLRATGDSSFFTSYARSALHWARCLRRASCRRSSQ